MLQLVVLQSFRVNAIRIVDRAIPFSNANTCSPSTGQVSACVKTNITEALHDICFASPSCLSSNEAHVVRVNDEVLKAVEYSSACSRSSSMNTTLVDWFPCNASRCIHVLVSDGVRKGVSNPSHLSFSSSHVGSRNVNSGSKESLFCQLNSKSSCDSFELILTIGFGINLNTSFATSKRNIDACTLVSHQGRQSLDFISANIQRVTDTSFAWTPVM